VREESPNQLKSFLAKTCHECRIFVFELVRVEDIDAIPFTRNKVTFTSGYAHC